MRWLLLIPAIFIGVPVLWGLLCMFGSAWLYIYQDIQEFRWKRRYR